MVNKKKQTADAWRDFFILNKDNVSGVREEIKKSWKRSKDYGIDVEKDLYVNRAEENIEYSKSVKEHSNFVDIAKPYIVDLYNIIKESGFAISLTDEEGYILHAMISPSIKDTTVKIANFSEKSIGTNGIGTCLYLDKPIEIWGEEFACAQLHGFSTCAAPIHHETKKLIGSIAVTGHSDILPLHTLGMATAIAYAIENKITLSNKNNSNLMVQDYANLVSESISHGIIILDDEGNIGVVNKAANNILKVKENDFLGKNINDIIKAPFDFKNFIRDDFDFYKNEISVYIAGKPTRCEITLTNSKKGKKSIGLVITLKVIDNEFTSVHVGKIKNKLYTFDDFIGEADSIRNLKELAIIASKSESNVLIMGESGTGKELIAQSIHSSSARKDKPFIAVNCGALPLTLVESELFGYEGGAYTGSKKDGQAGKFELADGGTIFLDEIGELPLSIQASLLRVIQERKLMRVGGTKEKHVNLRIIAATNKNLFEAVKNNSFRIDLFYRINVFNINILPLRQRSEDILPLSSYFINKYNERFGTKIQDITEEAKNILLSYQWFGNVRELENTIERAVQIAQNLLIDVQDLPLYMQEHTITNQGKTNSSMNLFQSNENKALIDILKRNNGNVKATADELKISRVSIYRKIEKYGIILEKFRI